MSAPEMMTQKPEKVGDFEEVKLYDAELEKELFGGMDFVTEEESEATTSSPAASTDTAATSQSPRATTAASDMEDKALLAEHDQKCFGAGAVVGTTNPSKLVKSPTHLACEEEKRLKLERRAMALKEAEAKKAVPTPATTNADVGAPKRKRGLDDEAGGKGTKRKVTEAAATEIKKQSVAPVATTSQKRKRGADDDEGEKPAKRGLTDAVATEIGQRREHAFPEDLKGMDERRDSVIGAGNEGPNASIVVKVQQGSKPEEQHLAPPVASDTCKKVPGDLNVTEDDDEMTRMLKEELAKPYVKGYSDDESEPEDPRVEEILKPLTEAEKLFIADMLVRQEKAGKPRPTIEGLKKSVEITLAGRAKEAKKKKTARGEHGPIRTSPLANEGIKAKEQDIDQRPKLAPKSPKVAPKTTETTAPAVTTTATTPAVSKASRKATTSPSASTTSPPATSSRPQPPLSTRLNVPDLKKLCRDRSLTVGGNKKKLITRLEDYDYEIAVGQLPMGLKAPKKVKKHVYSWMK